MDPVATCTFDYRPFSLKASLSFRSENAACKLRHKPIIGTPSSSASNLRRIPAPTVGLPPPVLPPSSREDVVCHQQTIPSLRRPSPAPRWVTVIRTSLSLLFHFTNTLFSRIGVTPPRNFTRRELIPPLHSGQNTQQPRNTHRGPRYWKSKRTCPQEAGPKRVISIKPISNLSGEDFRG